MVLKKSFRALGAIKSIEKRGVIVHGTYFNATIAVYVTLNLRLGKDEVGGSNPPSSSRKTLQPQWLQGSFFFDEEVKRAAAMPVATVWLLSMMRCLRPSRTHKSLCPTLDNCASFCPSFVLLQR